MDNTVGTAVSEPAQLEVRGGGRTWRTAANRAWTVGRSARLTSGWKMPDLAGVRGVGADAGGVGAGQPQQ